MVIDMRPYRNGFILYTIQPNDTLYTLAQRFGTSVQSIIAANPGVDLRILYVGQRIYIPSNYRNANPNNISQIRLITEAEFTFSNLIRMLWEQHIIWTRLAIISMVFDLPDVELVTNRLLRNPNDFAEAFLPFYGPAAASRFAELLRQHLVLAAQLVNQAKAGDNVAAAETERIWYDNAREIAAFLASINPYWSRQEWENMYFNHLRLVKAEAVDMLNKNYLAGINLYDEMERQALMMADVMTSGIIRQFPERFR